MSAAGSELCQACGFCCDGTLFDDLRVSAEEARDLHLRLPIYDDGGRPSVRFPCPAHQASCTIYDARPQTCRTYRCDLLDRVDADELDLASATARVAWVRERIASLRPRLPDEGAYFWAEVDRLGAQTRAWKTANAELLLEIVALRETLSWFFDRRSARGLSRGR